MQQPPPSISAAVEARCTASVASTRTKISAAALQLPGQVTGSCTVFLSYSDNDKPARFVDVHPGDVFVFPRRCGTRYAAPPRRPSPGAMALKMHPIVTFLSFTDQCWVRSMPLRLHLRRPMTRRDDLSRVGPS